MHRRSGFRPRPSGPSTTSLHCAVDSVRRNRAARAQPRRPHWTAAWPRQCCGRRPHLLSNLVALLHFQRRRAQAPSSGRPRRPMRESVPLSVPTAHSRPSAVPRKWAPAVAAAVRRRHRAAVVADGEGGASAMSGRSVHRPRAGVYPSAVTGRCLSAAPPAHPRTDAGSSGSCSARQRWRSRCRRRHRRRMYREPGAWTGWWH